MGRKGRREGGGKDRERGIIRGGGLSRGGHGKEGVLSRMQVQIMNEYIYDFC